MRKFVAFAALGALVSLSGCATADKAKDGVASVGETVASGVSGVGSVATSLVKVDLSNVLNNLALDLNIDKANIPVNAQIPISVAANVCGVTINILSIGGGGRSQGCTATTTSPELSQAVQQQIAAGGNVGGGTQSTTPTTTIPTTTTQPAAQPAPEPTGTSQ